MKRILNYLLVLLMVTPFISLNISANTTRYVTLANPSVFEAKDQWEALGGASLDDAAVVVSGTNQAGGLFSKSTFSVAGSNNKGFTAYFNLTHTFETGTPKTAVLTEGVVFVLAKNPIQIGSAGDGKGYRGMDQSLGFEIDLYSQVDTDFSGMHVHDKILANGVNPTEDNGLMITNMTSFKNIHVWIEYEASLNRVYFYVNQANLKPQIPNATYDASAITSFFSSPFHIGVTSATNAESVLELKSLYFLSNYDERGIDPTLTYITDNVVPTSPLFNISKTGNTYNVSLTGSTDTISGIKEYEYSYNNTNWFTFTPGSITVTDPQYIYARAIDLAGNISEVSMTRFFTVDLSYGVIKDRETNLYYLGQNVALPVNPANATDYIKSWVISGTTTQVTNINELTGPTVLVGQIARHLFNITYDANTGVLPENLKSTHSILGANYTLPEATKEGYRFVGWYSGDILYQQLDQTLNKNLTLTATFEPLTTTINFYDFNQNIVTIEVTTEGVILRIDPLEVPDGFQFVGYFTEPFGQGERVTNNTYIPNAHTFRIYPHIIPIEDTIDQHQTLLSMYSENTSSNHHTILPYIVLSIGIFTSFTLYIIMTRGKRYGK